MTIKKGDKVKAHYVGTLEDGSEFDNSEKHGHPLEFEVGSGQLIKGFDDAVMGMNKGDSKDITLQPEEAYGQPNPELKKEIPRDQLPQDQEPQEGMMLMMQLQNGQQIPAKITEITDKVVTVDLNHPLAGKVLNFKITIVDIEAEGTFEKSEKDCGDDCGCDHDHGKDAEEEPKKDSDDASDKETEDKPSKESKE